MVDEMITPLSQIARAARERWFSTRPKTDRGLDAIIEAAIQQALAERAQELERQMLLKDDYLKLADKYSDRVQEAESRLQQMTEERDGFWTAIERCFEIEPREYFEKEYAQGFKSPLEMLAHWLWKRDAKVQQLTDGLRSLRAHRLATLDATCPNLDCDSDCNHGAPCDKEIGTIAALLREGGGR